jgi:hypothetical protein
MPDIKIESLKSVLKTYALYNPGVEYCQGMNYLAGFLLSVFQDEEVTFKALHSLCVKQEMAMLFNTELPRLKLYFLSLDRLLAIADPPLY